MHGSLELFNESSMIHEDPRTRGPAAHGAGLDGHVGFDRCIDELGRAASSVRSIVDGGVNAKAPASLSPEQ